MSFIISGHPGLTNVAEYLLMFGCPVVCFSVPVMPTSKTVHCLGNYLVERIADLGSQH